MAWNANRSRPTAVYLPAVPHGSGAVSVSLGRHVLLRSGRGDLRLSADEAVALAGELIEAARVAASVGPAVEEIMRGDGARN